MSCLAIDIGNSRIKAMTVDDNGRRLGLLTDTTPVISAGKTVEIVPDRLAEVVEELIAASSAAHNADPIVVVVFACSGTACVPVGKHGRPLHNALSPLDERPPPRLPANLDREQIHRRTGQCPDAVALLHHYLWLRRHRPRVVAATERWLSVRSFLLQRFCGETVEDVSWASRTMLFDLRERRWAREICAAVGLDPARLPPLVRAATTLDLLSSVRARLGLGRAARAVVGGLDNCCATAGGTGRQHPNVNLIGTYEHLLIATPRPPAETVRVAPGVFTFAHVVGESYVSCTRAAVGRRWAELQHREGGPRAVDTLLRRVNADPIRFRTHPLASLIIDACVRHRRLLARGTAEHGDTGGVAVVGGGSRGTAALQLRANLLARPLSLLAVAECGALGALRVAFAATTGCSPATAAEALANPVVAVVEPDPRRTAVFDTCRRESNAA